MVYVGIEAASGYMRYMTIAIQEQYILAQTGKNELCPLCLNHLKSFSIIQYPTFVLLLPSSRMD